MLTNCLIGVRSRIGKDCKLTGTVMIGSDTFETTGELAANRAAGLPDFNVGDGSEVGRAILDKDCRIGKGVKILIKDARPDFDDPQGRYHVRDGIVCVPRGGVIPDGMTI